MKLKLHYGHTVFACCFANGMQAVSSVIPILLIPLKNTCGLSYTQFGILISLNFCTQITADVLFSKPVDKYGFRPFAIGAPIVAALGLCLFAFAPQLFPQSPFIGFCVAIILFAAAAGIQELLLNPILEALPTDDSKRSRRMSLMHSFFAWGQLAFIPITTLFLWRYGDANWRVILLIWAALLPLSSVIFSIVPIKEREQSEKVMSTRGLISKQVFLWAVAAIIFGGATEVTIAQWASAFLERGLLLPKAVGDIVGACGFALMLATGRTLYAIVGGKLDIHRLMLCGSLMSVALYLTAGLSGSPLVGLLACTLTGFSASLLWPGSISVVSRCLPMAGASLFALMSAAGDVGASSGVFLVGRVADAVSASAISGAESAGLRAGMLVASIFPLLCSFAQLGLQRAAKKELSQAPAYIATNLR